MIVASPEQLTRAWRSLQNLIPVQTIHTEDDYDRAVTALNTLVDTVGTDTTHPLYTLLDTLGTLVQTYEDHHEPPAVSTNIGVLQFLLSEHGLTADDLADVGEPAQISAILAGRQPLTTPMRHALARRFGITPETLSDA